jgi:hypothetical protein
MKTIPLTPVVSSNIAALGYDSEAQIALVQFIGGALYAYKGVPPEAYDSLRTAPSIGAHLNRNFKNVYVYERVQEQTNDN